VEVTHPKITGSREELPILVEADCEHAVGGVKCLFYAVSVMNVDVDVENPLVIPK
jgi:hypothetical protein